MLKRLKRVRIYIATIFLMSFMVAPAAVSAQLFDGSRDEACKSLNATNDGVPVAGTSQNACGTTNNQRLSNIIELVLNLLSLAVGIIAVVMVIISGLKYITSQGDSAGVSSAKNTLLYAVIGLIIVAMSQFIVRFVLEKTDTDQDDTTQTTQTLQPGAN